MIREFPDQAIRLILETPDIVRGLLLVAISDLAKQINYDKLQQLNRTFIMDNFRKLEADMVFTAPFVDSSGESPYEVIIYILIENQSTVDPTMPFRVLSYMVRIWDMQRRELEDSKIPLHQWRFRPILPVVFYTGSQQWEAPLELKQLMDLPSSLERVVPQYEIFFLNLKSASPDDQVKEDHPFGWILRVMQKEGSTKREFEEALFLTLERLERMPPEEQVNWAKLVYFLLAFIHNRRKESEHGDLLKIVGFFRVKCGNDFCIVLKSPLIPLWERGK